MSEQPFMSQPSCHKNSSTRRDYLLLGAGITIIIAYGAWFLIPGVLQSWPDLAGFSHSVFAIMNTVWWGIVLGILMVGVLSKIPREFILAILGQGGNLRGIIRATLAGVLLDLCSHGILMVGMKLYERGASIGQVMAFLIASPWNSFSLTFVLIALIGLKWTLIFIALSLMIAIIAGWLFDRCVAKGILPNNPNKADLPKEFRFFTEVRQGLASTTFSRKFFITMLRDGITESRMVLRWLFFGVVLAALIRVLFSPDQFQTLFGPTFWGLMLTLLAATIIEVCSEGSTPLAADIFTRAGAPGNSFAFLMTGVATDYTEIMATKDTTKSWKIALFLPLLTVPQVIVIAWLINSISL